MATAHSPPEHFGVFKQPFDLIINEKYFGQQKNLGLLSMYLWITAWATKTHYSVLCSLSPSEYLMMLLRPIADICNQLRSPRYLKTPLECIPLDFGQCELTSSHFSLHQYLNAHSIAVYGATFTAEVIKPWTLTSTIILSLVRHIRCSLCYI